jgi:hypothetical protein
MKKLIALLLIISVTGCTVAPDWIIERQTNTHISNYLTPKLDYLKMVNNGNLSIALVKTKKTRDLMTSGDWGPITLPTHTYYYGTQDNILDSIVEAYSKCKLAVGNEIGCGLEMVGKYKSLESEKIFFDEFLTAIIDEYFQINIIYPVGYADMDLTKTYPDIDMRTLSLPFEEMTSHLHPS